MKKVYGKNIVVKGFYILMTILFLVVIFANGEPENAGAMTIGLVFFIFFLILTLKCFFKKVIIEDKHLIIKSGILFKKSQRIKYNKINSIDVIHSFGIGGIELHMGNDKPIIFKNLEDFEKVQEIVDKKIEELEK